MALRTLVASVVAVCLGALAFGQTVVINEIRTDEPGTDDNEYVELAGTPLVSLDGITLIVIGDDVAGGSGVIEEVISFQSGHALDANGLFLIAEATFTLGGTVGWVRDLSLENSDNLTCLLVDTFTGSYGDDLDIDDDGDTKYETDETFTVDLASPANATIADAQGVGTIQDDDESSGGDGGGCLPGGGITACRAAAPSPQLPTGRQRCTVSARSRPFPNRAAPAPLR